MSWSLPLYFISRLLFECHIFHIAITSAMLYVQTIFLGGMPHHYRAVSISVKTWAYGSYMDKTSILLPIALCCAISGFLFWYNIDAIFQPLLNINMISLIISYPKACYKLSFFHLLATIEIDFPIQFCLQVWNRNANTSNLFKRTSKRELMIIY